MNEETEFKYIDNIEEDKTPIGKEDKIQIEIAYQLKRIADKLESWEGEGELGTFDWADFIKAQIKWVDCKHSEV
jgi:hypothetical protein